MCIHINKLLQAHFTQKNKLVKTVFFSLYIVEKKDLINKLTNHRLDKNMNPSYFFRRQKRVMLGFDTSDSQHAIYT